MDPDPHAIHLILEHSENKGMAEGEPRILIAPLDWGLGHATRCIPVIKEVERQGGKPVLAGEGGGLELLKQEFPNTEIVGLKGYRVSYPRRGKMTWKMAMLAPFLLQRIYKEHRSLRRLVRAKNIDGVISDNRYGLWHPFLPSVFMTHQIHIRSPLLTWLLFRANKCFIERYDTCWIPDIKGQSGNLAGELCHSKAIPKNCRFVGPLSRFAPAEEEKGTPAYPDTGLGDQRSAILDQQPNATSPLPEQPSILALLSGPEPQRSMLEQEVLAAFKGHPGPKRLIRGLPEKTEEERSIEGTPCHGHLSSRSLREAIKEADVILSRPGYSTIMDLSTFGKHAIFIPTPGQTEQEYLARYHQKTLHCPYFEQGHLDLPKGLDLLKEYKGIPQHRSHNMLSSAIKQFLENAKK